MCVWCVCVCVCVCVCGVCVCVCGVCVCVCGCVCGVWTVIACYDDPTCIQCLDGTISMRLRYSDCS